MRMSKVTVINGIRNIFSSFIQKKPSNIFSFLQKKKKKTTFMEDC